jgi:hypothetical protein
LSNAASTAAKSPLSTALRSAASSAAPMSAQAHTPAAQRARSSAWRQRIDLRGGAARRPRDASLVRLRLRARSTAARAQMLPGCAERRACPVPAAARMRAQATHPSAAAGARAQRRRETEGFREGAALRAHAAARGGHKHTARTCRMRGAVGAAQRSGLGGARAQRCAAPRGRLRAPRQTAKPLRRRRRRACVRGGGARTPARGVC